MSIKVFYKNGDILIDGISIYKMSKRSIRIVNLNNMYEKYFDSFFEMLVYYGTSIFPCATYVNEHLIGIASGSTCIYDIRSDCADVHKTPIGYFIQVQTCIGTDAYSFIKEISKQEYIGLSGGINKKLFDSIVKESLHV